MMDRYHLSTLQERRDLGLYIHVPFCAKKCDYCDFLSAPADSEAIQQYFKALLIEINQYEKKTDSYIVPTIFIGGGTPSFVEANYIEEIMEAVRRVFTIDNKRLEATIEINPGTITKQKLLAYKNAGINRLSFGLQSVHNDELKILGRIHTYEQFKENYELARSLGFHNINIDLMSALPGQSLQSWENTLNTVIGLNPEHISAYSLIIEEGTKFYDRYQNSTPENNALPDEDTDRLMYYKTKEMLEENGYQRYEISNYSKQGYECRHNNSYWIGTEYLGLGLGAASLLNDTRFSNLHNNAQYVHACLSYQDDVILRKKCGFNLSEKKFIMEDSIKIRENVEILTRLEKMEEFMFLGLRRCSGISKNTFFHRFFHNIEEIYGDEIKQLIHDQLLTEDGDILKLTEYGLDVSNYVFAKFVHD